MSRNGIGLKQAVEGTKFNDPILTVQADRNEVDINRIVARIERGLAIPIFEGEPFYGDVSELGGLQEAIMKVKESEKLFMQYPASMREKFDNDPVKFVEFLSDSKNLDEARTMGLVDKEPVVEEAPPASPAPEGAKAQ